MKLNSVTTTTTPTPNMASRFWANVLATTAHGLPVAATSPPSGSTSTSTGLRSPASAGAFSVPDPGIEDRIADVRDEVAEHGDYPNQHRDPEHDLIIVAQRRLEILQSGARKIEHLLDDQRARDHQGDRQAHERDHRDQRVA